ncbi:hypothetical protein KBX06_22220 [Micromonospora sp. C31]|uniref:hypothetical protein n=1 Tax=Micromonospora sp. C31 TaxID=2824876 RepID=UPI001B36A72D|nr:hypothetical protein [Micromonospora sp. C31]MBQ1075853.1 hypothetical protein [Micromonospora sp. C31]
MRHQSRFLRRLGVTAAAATAVITLMPQAAVAAVVLDDGVVLRSTTGADHLVTTDRPAWAAAAVHSNSNYNISLFDQWGGWLTSSYGYGFNRSEFVAVNSHVSPLTSYEARTSTSYGPAVAHTQWRQSHTTTTLPYPANDGVTGPSDPDLAFAALGSTQVVSVSDIHLKAGEAFWVDTAPDTLFFLLESNPYDSTTRLRNRHQHATAGVVRTAQGCTLYRANHSGVHGLLMVADAAPVTTTPPGGTAVALHRYDPARPYTCPQRNFPGPTPPGV